MKHVAVLRVESIEGTETAGILLISLTGVKAPLLLKGELPEQFVVSKMNEGDVINLLLSSDAISLEDLRQYGTPILILNGGVFKRSKGDERVTYWISIHGLQFRLTSGDDFLVGVSTIWIGFAK